MSRDLSPQGLFRIRRLRAADATAYRELRLEGLYHHPEGFAASWEDESAKPHRWFAERLENNIVFAGEARGARLCGLAGLLIPSAAKISHKAVLWGMFVRPNARGTGLARALVAHAVERASTMVEEIRLTVVASNTPAVRLYAAAGFLEYGREYRAMKIGDKYYDEILMALSLHRRPDQPGVQGPGTEVRSIRRP